MSKSLLFPKQIQLFFHTGIKRIQCCIRMIPVWKPARIIAHFQHFQTQFSCTRNLLAVRQQCYALSHCADPTVVYKRVNAVNVSVTCQFIIFCLSSTRSIGVDIDVPPWRHMNSRPSWRDWAFTLLCPTLSSGALKLIEYRDSFSILHVLYGQKEERSVIPLFVSHTSFCLLFLHAGSLKVVAICSLYDS